MYILFLNILACQVSIFPIYFILHIYPIISFFLNKDLPLTGHCWKGEYWLYELTKVTVIVHKTSHKTLAKTTTIATQWYPAKEIKGCMQKPPQWIISVQHSSKFLITLAHTNDSGERWERLSQLSVTPGSNFPPNSVYQQTLHKLYTILENDFIGTEYPISFVSIEQLA